MAQRGRKADTPATKVARGTMQPTPSVLAQMADRAIDVPMKDEKLSDIESELWDSNIDHFVANGATSADSLILNDTVNMAAEIVQRRRLFMAGEDVDPPSVTSRVELRVRLEGFGMAGPKSRIGRIVERAGAKGKTSPFANNGNRTRP